MVKRYGVLLDLDGVIVEPFSTTPLPGVGEALTEILKLGYTIDICTNQSGPLWQQVSLLMNQEKSYPTVEDICERLLTIAHHPELRLLPERAIRWYIAVNDTRAARAIGSYIREMDIAAASADPTKHPDIAYDDDDEEYDVDQIALSIKEEMQARLSPHLSVQVSNALDWRKPAPGMLHAACAARGCSPLTCIYAGDRDGSQLDRWGNPMDSDKQAAKRAGMTFRSTLQHVLLHLQVRKEEHDSPF